MSDYQVKIQQYKVDAVNEIKEEFKDIKDFFFTDYRGMTVEQITDLRGKLREKNATLKVVKNRFAKIALTDLDKGDVANLLVGPTAIALSKDEAGPVAKVLLEYAKNAPIEIKGGLVDGQLFDLDQVEAFSNLPTRIELISKLMGTMQAPVQNFVAILNEVPTKFVRTLQAVADKKGSEG